MISNESRTVRGKIYINASAELRDKGYISPINVLVQMDRLTVKQVEGWRFKRINYLEGAINLNLAKLKHFLQGFKKYAKEHHLKPSVTVYKSWGKGAKKHCDFRRQEIPVWKNLV